MRTLTLESTMDETTESQLPKVETFKFWKELARHKGAMLGLAVLLLWAALAVVAPFITPHDPLRQQLGDALKDPSLTNPLGTDYLGRDILTRILYGARYSLAIGFAAVAIGALLGIPLGAISGYYCGLVDLIIQRFIDILLSFPGFLLALSLVAVLGVGIENVVIAVGVGVTPSFVRLVRASTLSIRQLTYIEAARCIGANDFKIIFHHVLPNAMAPVIVQATLSLGSAILLAAGLGFLGLGVQPPTPEWGTMLGEGRNYIFSNPNMATFPGIAIFLTVLAFNMVGDGLRDALDPHLRKR